MTKRKEGTGIAGAMEYKPTTAAQDEPRCFVCGGPWEKGASFSARVLPPMAEVCSAECEADPRYSGVPACTASAKVIEMVRSRAAFGLTKYGVTVGDRQLPRKQWMRHAQEESLDNAVYLQKLIDMEPDDTEPDEP